MGPAAPVAAPSHTVGSHRREEVALRAEHLSRSFPLPCDRHGRLHALEGVAVADDGSPAARAALVHGVPVVATQRACLTADELARGGFTVPLRDPAAVSACLEELAPRRDVRHIARHP